MKKLIEKLFHNNIFVTSIAFAVVFAVVGGLASASDFSGSDNTSKTVNVQGDFSGTLNIYPGSQEQSQVDPGNDVVGSALHNYNNTIFVNGLRAGRSATQIVNSSGVIVASVSNDTITTTGAGTIGTSLTVGTNITQTDGVFSLTYDVATSSDASPDMLTVTHTDASGLTAPNGLTMDFLVLNMEDASGSATSSCKFSLVEDNTSTTSQAYSVQLLCKNDGEYTLSNWLEMDSGDLIVDTNTLYVDASANRVGIGTSTPEAIFDIAGSGTATSTMSLGKFCQKVIASDGSTVRYIYYDAGTDDLATSSTSCF